MKKGIWVSIEEGKEMDKRSWENIKGEGNLGSKNLSQ
jgi:hypothetical protein